MQKQMMSSPHTGTCDSTHQTAENRKFNITLSRQNILKQSEKMYKAHISALWTTSLNFPPWIMGLPITHYNNNAFFFPLLW